MSDGPKPRRRSARQDAPVDRQVPGHLASSARARPARCTSPTTRSRKRKVAIKLIYPEALKSSEDGAFYKSMFLNEAGARRQAEPPAHRADLRRGGGGRVQLHRDGVRRGRHAREVLHARVAARAARGRRDHLQVRARARLRADARPHAPRPQARQHPPQGRHRDQDRGLRRRDQQGLGPHGDHQRGLARVHGAGAGHRRGAGLAPHRHLRARRGDVLHAHRAAAVHAAPTR